MPALSGKVARIRYTAAGATNSTNEAATLSTDTVTLTIGATAKRHWDSASTLPRVYSSTSTGTALSTTKFAVNHAQGKVVFKTAQSSTKTWKVDVAYLVTSYLTGGRNWSLDTETDALDITTFSTLSTANTKWRSFKPGLQKWAAKIDRLISSGDTGPLGYDRLAAASSNLIVELVVSGTGREKYEGRARVHMDNVGVDIDGLITEGLELEGHGALYYSTV